MNINLQNFFLTRNVFKNYEIVTNLGSFLIYEQRISGSAVEKPVETVYNSVDRQEIMKDSLEVDNILGFSRQEAPDVLHNAV